MSADIRDQAQRDAAAERRAAERAVELQAAAEASAAEAAAERERRQRDVAGLVARLRARAEELIRQSPPPIERTLELSGRARRFFVDFRPEFLEDDPLASELIGIQFTLARAAEHFNVGEIAGAVELDDRLWRAVLDRVRWLSGETS